MDTVRLRRQIRALRRRRGWRQQDLADAAGCSRSTISLAERGHANRLSLGTLKVIARSLSARFDPPLLWNGENLDWLLDQAHAALVEVVAARFRALGWDVAVEVSFAINGERGSVDVLGFHPGTGALAVNEIKSVVADVQGTIGTHDRKARLGPRIARERGWPVRGGASRVLIVADSGSARRRVAAHRVTFDAAYSARGWAVDRWLRSPDPNVPLSGLLFLPLANHPVARHRVRVRPDAIATPHAGEPSPLPPGDNHDDRGRPAGE